MLQIGKKYWNLETCRKSTDFLFTLTFCAPKIRPYVKSCNLNSRTLYIINSWSKLVRINFLLNFMILSHNEQIVVPKNKQLQRVNWQNWQKKFPLFWKCSMYVISCSNFDFRIQIFDMCRTRMHTKKIREEKHVEKPAELQSIY